MTDARVPRRHDGSPRRSPARSAPSGRYRGDLGAALILAGFILFAACQAAGAPPTGPAGGVVSLDVTPRTATVAPGGSLLFRAEGRDAAGAVVAVDVSWQAAGGSIDGTGRFVAGSAEGAFRVIATGAGLADTASVTVAAAGSDSTTTPTDTAGSSAAAECARPDGWWIWCDDFEQDRLSSYFEVDDANGRFVREAGVGRDGSYGMRGRFVPGESSAGNLKLAFGRTPSSYFRPVDAGTSDYRELYWRMYVKNQAGWEGGGGDKLFRMNVFATAKWAQAAIGYVWSGNPNDTEYLLLDPASGTDEQGNLRATKWSGSFRRWLGAVRGSTPLFDADHVGRWHCVEVHMKLNDEGLSNGIFEMWVDGSLDARETGLNWLGSYDAYGMNALFLENYWNAGPPKVEERYFDDVVVSTQRIGC